MTAQRLHPDDTRARRVWWLLDLEWAGQVLRLSNAEVDVVDANGNSLHYAGVLEGVDVDSGIEWLADASASPASARIAAVLPVDTPRLVAQGHDLASATGSLSRWIEGTTYEERRVVIEGQVSNPEYGAAHEEISCSLELTPWDGGVTIPPPGYAVEGPNFETGAIASLSPASLGLPYPAVFGQPGRVSESVFGGGLITGSQGVYFDQRTRTTGSSGSNVVECGLVLMYGHTSMESIYLKTATATSLLRYQVINTHDDKGHPITVAPWWMTSTAANDLYYDATAIYAWAPPGAAVVGCLGHASAPSSIQPTTGDDPVGTYAAWYDPDNPLAGGMRGRDGQAMRGAGEILETLIRLSGRPVDRGRWAAAYRLLDRYRLDFCIDANVDIWEFVRSNILPILPVSLVTSAAGIAPVVWRYDATSADAVAHLDTARDPLIQRRGNVTYDRELRNDIQLEYAYAVRTGQYLGKLRYTANGQGDDATPNLLCELSQRRYRRPDGEPLVASHREESIVIYEDATAHAVCQWMAAAYALARRRVEYLVPEADYAWLERGAVVTLTDEEIHLDSQVAVVEAVRIDGTSLLRMRFLLIEAPVRDSRLIQ